MRAMTALLAGQTPAAFLRDHWQKRPLLCRQALPGFRGLVDRRRLFALAGRSDVRSRLIIEHPGRRRGRFERHDGPLSGLSAKLLPASHYTVLVNGLERLVPGAWALLDHFRFVPTARIDDLMVSYAADQGTVGPHDDRYDVFLVQGAGRRRWQISGQADRVVDAHAGIRVLADFRAEAEWVLEPGDMLYLPPGVAHYGVALEPGFTYSVGFLAPSHAELVAHFGAYLGARAAKTLDPDALYQDPDLVVPADPLAVPEAMVDAAARLARALAWDRATIGEFLGCFLTQPRPGAAATPPRRPLPLAAFAAHLRRRGALRLSLATRALVTDDQVFVAGVAHRVNAITSAIVRPLLAARQLALPLGLTAAATELVYDWYRQGHVELNARARGGLG
jgi:50S ribosomal protein L16 3-hydroxylase